MRNLTAFNKGFHGEPRNWPVWYTNAERREAEAEFMRGRKAAGHKGKGN